MSQDEPLHADELVREIDYYIAKLSIGPEAANDLLKRARDRIVGLQQAINGPLGWKATYADDLRQLSDKDRTIADMRAQLAASSNYVANCDTEPTRIVFANGRIVTAIGGYLCVGMQDSVHVQACRPHDRAVLATSEGKEMLARAIDQLNNETAI